MKKCPVCNSMYVVCPECGKMFAHGARSQCNECNIRLYCAGCDQIVDSDLIGVLDLKLNLTPYKAEGRE